MADHDAGALDESHHFPNGGWGQLRVGCIEQRLDDGLLVGGSHDNDAQVQFVFQSFGQFDESLDGPAFA